MQLADGVYGMRSGVSVNHTEVILFYRPNSELGVKGAQGLSGEKLIETHNFCCIDTRSDNF
jgi:hypothetical protein